MRKQQRILLITSVMIAGLAATSALYARDDRRTPGSTMRMMEQCGQMMQGMMGGLDSQRPNDQWRKAPTKPEEKS